MEIKKRGATIRFGQESLFNKSLSDTLRYSTALSPEFRRKVDRVEILEPTHEEIELHAEATRLWARLEEIGMLCYEPGGGAFVEDLEQKRVVHYAETHEEWLARCRALEAGE